MAKARPSDHSETIKSLEAEIKKLEDLKEQLIQSQNSWRSKYEAMLKETTELKATLEKSYEKIRSLEESVGAKKDGYVEVAITPSLTGVMPTRNYVDGVLVPRKIDDDKTCHEWLPVQQAVELLSETNSHQKYLLGPVNKITGNIKVGLYSKEVSFSQYKKDGIDRDGRPKFIRVIIEESKSK